MNRGWTVNRLLVGDGRRLWLLGSGPSPAAARALDCQVARQLGRRVTDVVNAWAQAQGVLGNAGFARARIWAHEDVAAQMARQCPVCEARLRQRLGDAAVDLGPAPVRLPGHRLQGDSGVLGPWRWWRLWRAEGQPVTVWQVRGRPLWAAPGLLWGDGPPDLRDTDSRQMARVLAEVAALPQAMASAHWLPEQGGWQPPGTLVQHRQYLQGLTQAVRERQQSGGAEAEPAPTLPGLPDSAQRGYRHELNWQRAWRQEEAAWFDAPAAASGAAR